MRRLTWLLCLCVLVCPATVAAQRGSLDAVKVGDTTIVHVVRLRDGSTLVGRITAVTADSVRMQLNAGPFSLARRDVSEVREASRARIRNGQYWFENPHSTRLLF